MKKVLFICFLGLILGFGKSVKANPPLRNYVFEVKHFSAEKHVALFNSLLREYGPENHVLMACENKGWVVIQVDETKIHQAEHLERLFKEGGIDLLLKQQATVQQVQEACGSPVKQY